MGLLKSLKERYGDKLEVTVVDPRNPLALWDIIRYRAWMPNFAWIVNRKKTFEGIPGLEELERSIDVALGVALKDVAKNVEE